MEEVLSSVMPGAAFILGIADNAMPNSKFERLRAIGRMVREPTDCPVERAQP